jgi:hypothetical protein
MNSPLFLPSLIADSPTDYNIRYNNLMFLKTYTGDVSDLCLTFTVANDDFGVSEWRSQTGTRDGIFVSDHALT